MVGLYHDRLIEVCGLIVFIVDFFILKAKL